ncbi:MAG: AAA family ATPase [Thermoplasmata archaeon M8B2D]|nr:MAG: AAA family ATPase [Thermoplasmata archaeon M8B2D]
MILKTLNIRNFRKFKSIMIEFPDGVTGVVGLNGAGKSTIFEAIAWVLYGSVAARTSSDQIKRQAAETSDPCRVELEFIFENESYRIVREMTGKSLTASATATVNGKVAATSAESVTKFIQKKLGLDFKSFFTSIFAKQKELNTLSSMNASERRPLILRMLGIDSLDEVIKEVRSDKKQKDLLIEKISGDLIDEKGRNKSEIYNNEIKKYEKNKKEINEILKKYAEKIEDLNKKLKTIEKYYLKNKNDYENLNKKKEDLFEKKTLYENKIKIQYEIKELRVKISERQKAIEKEKKKLIIYRSLKHDIKKTEKRLDEINIIIEKIVKSIEQKKTLSIRVRDEIDDIIYKKKNIEKLGPEAECPTCERLLSDQYNLLLEKFEKEKTGKEKEIENFEKQIKKLNEEKERIYREQGAFQKKKNYLETQIREKDRIDTTIEHLSNEINSEKKIIENKEKIIKKINIIAFDSKEFENVKKQVENLYKNYQKSLEFLNNQKDELNKLNIEFEKKEGGKRLLDQEIKNLKEKVNQLDNYRKKIKEEKNAVHYLGILSEIMSDFRTFLISRIRPTLSSYSSDFFTRLTDGKYAEVELDENYDLLIYDNGEKYNITRFSGGEEDLANLCLRLAISEVITERAGGVFNFIILDEIFGSQDSIRRHNIMKALASLSSKFRQIFLITHVEDVKNDMENIIFVTENEVGISSVKIE